MEEQKELDAVKIQEYNVRQTLIFLFEYRKSKIKIFLMLNDECFMNG